ncbi:PAS domain S-box protein [Methylomonas koyamae]|uniref:PAS domain S-box protein n=2 Tax=Methylomonas koyamae TaxID=702114 RepID=UPI0018E0A537|nr:PAS domain S-box protein [Methylomonas koyamae]
MAERRDRLAASVWERAMRALFLPAVAVMNRLSFSKKFAVIGILSLLAVLAVFFNLYQNLNRSLTNSQRELAGLSQIARATRVFQLVQQHRGLSAGLTGGMEALRPRRDIVAAQVTAAIGELAAGMPGGSLPESIVHNLQAEWAQLLRQQPDLDWQRNYQAHGRLTSGLLDLEGVISDESRLVSESSLDSYHLVMVVVEQLPKALDNVGRLRGMAVGILAAKRIDAAQKLELAVLQSRIADDIARLEHTAADFLRYNPAQYPLMAATLAHMRQAADLLTGQVVDDLLQERFSVGPEYFFSAATLAIDSGFERIYTGFLPAAERLIRNRIGEMRTTLAVSVGIPGFLLVLIAYFSIGAHLSLSASIAGLAKAAKAFAEGDLQQRLAQDSGDEIGHVAGYFNRMADGFAALLAGRKLDEIRLRSIVNTALDAVVQMNGRGEISGWNRQAEAIFGWQADQVLGRPLHETIIPERLRAEHVQGLQHYLAGGEGGALNRRIEVAAVRRSGEEFPVELAITPIKLADTTEFNAFIRDISLEKQSAATMLDSEQRYRALFEFSLDAIMTLSPERGFLSANPAAVKLFGCRDLAHLLTLTPVSLSPEYQPNGTASAELAARYIGAALCDGAHHFEWQHKRVSGELFFAEVQLSRLAIGNEQLVQATVRDISERKLAKLELVASEARNRAILRTMADGVVLIDSAGTVLLVNDAVCEIFGYEEHELLGSNVSLLMPEPHRSRHDAYLANYMANRTYTILNRCVEFEGARTDGSTFPLELTVSELIDDQGSTFIGVIRDISERKAVQAAQEQARLQAEHLAQVKSDFLANMSHEIRTPLNAILGLARINLRDAGSENSNVAKIYEAGQHLLNVVNDILDFSKIESGKMQLDPHPFKLADLIGEVRDLLDLRVREKQLTLVVQFDSELPEWVVGDGLRLRQILLNLLSNAVKFTERGYVAVKIGRRGGDVRFAVMDSGIGMTEEQLPRLFTAFEQADTSTTRKFGGSGLGLAISRNLARLMGGDIEVQSSYGAGSTFVLTLPLPAAEPGAGDSGVLSASGLRLHGLRILAAEDVELNRLVLADILDSEGAEVVFAENGQQVLDLLQQHGVAAFDLVLMDIQMPVMDGYQAARRLAEIAPDLPVIGLTAHAMEDERKRCLEAGMKDRVTKPVDENALVKAILKALPYRVALPAVAPDLTPLPAATVPKPDAPPSSTLIDWQAMLERFDGRQAFVDKIIDNALDGSQQQNLEKLRLAAEQGDLAAIKFVAHNLKAFAGIFQAQGLLQLAQQTEAAARDGNAAATASATELADVLQQILQELRDKRSA